MKILILNGSPRCQGLISRMLDIMAEEARIRGAEVEAISIHKLQVRPCTGCMACRSRQACVLPEDDAQRTLQKIQWADVLIVGSPCYWGNMNGHLKVVFDRIVYGMMGESPKGLPQDGIQALRSTLKEEIVRYLFWERIMRIILQKNIIMQ